MSFAVVSATIGHLLCCAGSEAFWKWPFVASYLSIFKGKTLSEVENSDKSPWQTGKETREVTKMKFFCSLVLFPHVREDIGYGVPKQ